MIKLNTKLLALACGVALAASAAGVLMACDTPVYRYSMYSWEPAGYTVYIVHEGDEGAAQPVIDAVNQMNGDPEGAMANLWAVPIDLAADPHLRTVPTPVAEAWNSLPDKSTPRCMVISPKGALLHSEMLTPEELPTMVDSPARQELIRQLEEGKVGVFIYLATSDTPEDDPALLETQAFIGALADGALELLTPTGPPGYQPAPGAPDSFVEVGFLRVNRDDPAEQWLVNMLLHVEDDLTEYHDQPMVFAAFGRGRVLEPYVGNGVSMENLADGIDFIRGACSCTVRDENPGLDMLTYYNWEKAATLMAQRHGAEEGATRHLGGGAGVAIPQGIFPEIRALEPTAGGSDQAPVRQLSPELIDGARGQGSVAEGGTALVPGGATETTPGEEEVVVDAEGETAADTVVDSATPEEEAVAETEGEETAVVETEVPSAQEVAADVQAAEEAIDAAGAALAAEDAAAEEAAEGENLGEVAAASPETGSHGAQASDSTGMATTAVWTILIGAGVGLAVLLAATFFLFRPTA